MPKTSLFQSARTREIAITAAMIVLFIASLALAYGISHPPQRLTVAGLTFSLPAGWQMQPTRGNGRSTSAAPTQPTPNPGQLDASLNVQSQVKRFVDKNHPGRSLFVLTLDSPVAVPGNQALASVASQLIPGQALQAIQKPALLELPGDELTGWIFMGQVIVQPASAHPGPPHVQAYNILLLTADQHRYWVFYVTDSIAHHNELPHRAQLDRALLQTLRESAVITGKA